MIIYGTGSTKGQIIQTDKICDSCNLEDSILIVPYHQYFHLFWIPFFPIGTKYLQFCEKCGVSIEKSSGTIPPEIKKHIKKPIWHFLGLFLVVALFAYIAISSNIEAKSVKANKEAYIENPVVGDVYEYKTTDSEYSLMKVVSFDKDSIYVVFNEYVTTKAKGLDKLKKIHSSSYELENYGISREYVKEMADNNTILKINR